MEKVCNYVQCCLFFCRNLHNNSLCNKSCLPLEGAAGIDWCITLWNCYGKWPIVCCVPDGGEGGGVKFCKRHDFKGVNFKNQQNVRGVEILRHRTGLLCKSCQTILWLKQIHVPSKEHQKIHFGGSLSATKCYPYKARPRNLSTISPTRNVACMCVYTFMHTAEI